jgi:hypothetical protein
MTAFALSWLFTLLCTAIQLSKSCTLWHQRLRDARLAFVFVDPDRAVALRLLLLADFLFADFARFTRSGRFARPVSRFHSS